MLFDTHCHLNFKIFQNNYPDIIQQAREAGIKNIVIPGTDIESSRRAIEIAEKFAGLYAAVGIHPHHLYQSKTTNQELKDEIKKIEKLLKNKKVVAIGEVGIDRYIYQKTKYQDYKVGEEFIDKQKIFLKEQINLAIKYDKSLILHNREARKDIIEVLRLVWCKKLKGRTVFHCCEPEEELLKFAQNKKIFIGVDGDVTNDKKKQEFVKKVPLVMLVLETDSPFLMPRLPYLLPSEIKYNQPKNLIFIAQFIAKLKNISLEKLIKTTTDNAKKLFNLDKE